MATIMPQNELVRRALVFIVEKYAEKPGKSLADLLDEAGMRFNLGPGDAASLERLVLLEIARTKEEGKQS